MKRCLMLVLAVLAMDARAQIDVTTSSDVGGNAGECTLGEALANVSAGGKVGNNSCAAGTASSDISDPDEIRLGGLNVVVSKPLLHTNYAARIVGPGSISGDRKTRILEMFGGPDATSLEIVSVTLKDGDASGKPGPDVGEGGDGGAILVKSGGTGLDPTYGEAHLYLLDAKFIDNAAGSNGGAISFGARGVFDVEFTLFRGNRARMGGAVNVDRAEDFDVSSATFESNRARDEGGAIKCSLTAMVLLESRLVKNEVTGTGQGGALSLSGCWAGIDRVKFDENKVANGNGGAVYQHPSELPMKIWESRLTKNSAASSPMSLSGGLGGAIYADGPFEIVKSGLAGNRGFYAGGAVFVGPGAGGKSSKIWNASFIENESMQGGAIFLPGVRFGYVDFPASPLGRRYNLSMLHTTFARNKAQDAQISIEEKFLSDAGDVLFANSIVEGDVIACNTNSDKLTSYHPNQALGTESVVTDPFGFCGRPFASGLGGKSTGGYWYQPYVLPATFVDGDPAVCAVVWSEDQFSASRKCKLGAVEVPAPIIADPPTPQ